MKHVMIIILIAAVLLALTGCAARPNEYQNSEPAAGETAGFFQGLWHGFISPIAFVVSLFNPEVGVYDVQNNGGWYNFGFLLGAAVIFGGGGRGSSRRRH